MSRKLATLISWIFAFLMLTKELEAVSVDEKALEPGPLTILSLILEHNSIQEKSLNETSLVANCPNLWTKTEKEFIQNEKTGILGSFTELQSLCPIENPNFLCKAAFWISNYVCIASQHGKLQPPVIDDLQDLTNVTGLCNALVENHNLTQKLCGIVGVVLTNNIPLKQKLEKSCSLPNGSNNCSQYCGENQRLCRIILQSLRTIVSWEEKKEIMLNETVTNAETETTSSVAKESDSQHLIHTLPSTNQLLIPNAQLNLSQSIHPALLPTLLPTLPTAIKSDTDGDVKKTTKSPSTVQTDIYSSVNTETTVTDEDFGDGDDIFESAVKPPMKTADEETVDEVYKEEVDTDKQTEKIVVKTQETIPSYSLSSDNDDAPINTHFLFYFIAFVFLSACGYFMFVRRKYLIALVLEGRTNSSRRRSNSFRERPASSGNYRKLVNNLEDAITSSSVKNSNVIY